MTVKEAQSEKKKDEESSVWPMEQTPSHGGGKVLKGFIF